MTFRPLTRDQLAKFLPDQEAIRRFEQLFTQAGELTPAEVAILTILIAEVSVDAGIAQETANQVSDSLARIAYSLEIMATNPQFIPMATDVIEVAGQTVLPDSIDVPRVEMVPDIFEPPLQVGTLAEQNADNVRVGELTATGNIESASYSVNGNPGASGTGTVLTAMTVENGIITSITIA